MSVWCPYSVFFDQGVRQNDELSHDCCQRDFGRFARFDHTGVESAHVGIVPTGDEGRHLERVSQMFSATADGGASFPLSGLPCDRGEACQTGGGLGRERSDLGHVREDGLCDDGANTLDALDAGQGLAASWAAEEARANGGVNLGNLRLNQLEAGRCQASAQGFTLCAKLVACTTSVFDQCAAYGLQLIEKMRISSNNRVRLKLQSNAHSRQNLRIHLVGFGAYAARLGKATGVQWIDLAKRGTPGQSLLEGAVISAGWLIDDTRQCFLSEPGKQILVSRAVIWDLYLRPVTQSKRIDPVFGDIAANGILRHLCNVLCLSSGAETPGIRSGLMAKTGAGQTQRRSLATQAATTQPPPLPAINGVAGNGPNLRMKHGKVLRQGSVVRVSGLMVFIIHFDAFFSL